MVTNRRGDVHARTSGFESLTSRTGLLDIDAPKLTRYVFTDPRARTFFTDWDDIGDEQVFDLWLAPSVENADWLTAELSSVAGPDFTRGLNRHIVPPRGTLRLTHPAGHELQLLREVFELPADAQQLVVFPRRRTNGRRRRRAPQPGPRQAPIPSPSPRAAGTRRGAVFRSIDHCAREQKP
jgi:transcription regulator MmyB-like protein